MTDAHGCKLTDQTVIIHPEAMAIDLGFRDTVLCVGQQLHLSAVKSSSSKREGDQL